MDYDKIVKEMIKLKLIDKENSKNIQYFLDKYKIKRNVLVDISKDVLIDGSNNIAQYDNYEKIRWSVRDEIIDRINKHKAWKFSITIAIISLLINLIGCFILF